MWCRSLIPNTTLSPSCSIALYFLTSLPLTLSSTSCTESSCSSLCKIQIPSTAATLSTLSPSAGFSLPLSTCTLDSMHQFSVAPPNAVWYDSMLNVHHCVVVVAQRSRKHFDDTFLAVWVHIFPKDKQKAYILVFSARSTECGWGDEAISLKNHEGQCGFTGWCSGSIGLIY